MATELDVLTDSERLITGDTTRRERRLRGPTMTEQTHDPDISFEDVNDVLMAHADEVITKVEARQLLGLDTGHVLSADCWCDPEVTSYADGDDE